MNVVAVIVSVVAAIVVGSLVYDFFYALMAGSYERAALSGAVIIGGVVFAMVYTMWSSMSMELRRARKENDAARRELEEWGVKTRKTNRAQG